MSTITKQWLQQTIAEMEEHRNLFHGDLDDNHANVLAALRIALASLEAVPVGTFKKGPCGYHPSFHEDAVPLYTAPPAPVYVPAAMEMDDDFDSSFEHGKAVGWNACRAAMLQGAEPVKTAYKLPGDFESFISWLTSGDGIPDWLINGDKLDDEKVSFLLKVYRAGGNSPVIPDGWVMVPKEATSEMINSAMRDNETGEVAEIYELMLAAAPHQEVK